MAQTKSNNNGAARQGSAVTRTKNRRSLSLIIYISGMFLIYAFDKVRLDSLVVWCFKWLNEDGTSWFNPAMVESGLQVILVGGFIALTWMALKTAKDEEA